MVRVAVCPKCSHESVMFDQADSEQWARCPDCRTHFQIKNASARDIPQLVMTKDEALLADEESETAKETVISALETRWDTRRTINAASTQTIAGVESSTTSNSSSERNESQATSSLESANDQAKRTIADFSNLATWSDLPADVIEAQARAEQAGDTPADYPSPSQTPTLRIRRSRDTNEDAHSADKSLQSSGDGADRFNKWFETKETIFDFTPPTMDESANNLVNATRPQDDSAESSEAAEDEAPSATEIDAASDEPSSDEEQASDVDTGSTTPNNDRREAPPALPPAWPPGRPAPNWARPSRRRSPLRTFVMIGFGGVVGLALGYYALMWITGPSGDFLDAAQYLPSAILPREYHAREVNLPASDDMTSEMASEPDVKVMDDQPASAETALLTDEADENNLGSEAGPPAKAIEIVGAPSFSADELAVALRKAKEVQAGLVTGNFVDGGAVKRTKGQSYMAFCDLAQKATFVDTYSNASYASALLREVHDLVRATLADTHAEQEVAHLVPLWIKSTKRTHAGIFFAGHVAREVHQGPIVEWQIDLGHESITVLANGSTALVNPPARPVVILGWIVDNPTEQVTGYTGQAQQAVWAGHIIPLE